MGYKLIVTVKNKAKCEIHEVGDQFVLEKGEVLIPIKGKLCAYALACLIPLLTVLAVDLPASHWGNKEISTWQCLDSSEAGPVTFEVKREKE